MMGKKDTATGNEKQPLLDGHHPGKTRRVQPGLMDMPDDILCAILAKVLNSTSCSIVIHSGADQEGAAHRMRRSEVMSKTALAFAPTFAHLSTLRATHRHFRILVDSLFLSKDFCQEIGDRIVGELNFGDQCLSWKDEKEIRQLLLTVGQSVATWSNSQPDEKEYINNPPDKGGLTMAIQRAAKTIDSKQVSRVMTMKRECLEHPKAFGASYGVLVGLVVLTAALGGAGKLSNGPIGPVVLSMLIALAAIIVGLAHTCVKSEKSTCTPRPLRHRVGLSPSFAFFVGNGYEVVPHAEHLLAMQRDLEQQNSIRPEQG